MNKSSDKSRDLLYVARKRDLLNAVEKISDFRSDTEKNAYKDDLIKKTEEHPDVVEFLCNLKDKDGEKLFDNLDIIGILHNTSWLIENKPEVLKQAISQNINTIAKSNKRGIAVFSLPGMPSMEYCKTGSDITTNYGKWRELSERTK